MSAYCVLQWPGCLACIIMLNPHSNPMRLCCSHHHHHPYVMAEKLGHSAKEEKSGLFLVSLVKYLIKEEIEALWNFLSVVGEFQPPVMLSFPIPFLPLPVFTFRGRGVWGCWCLQILTLWYLWHIPFSKGLDTYLVCPPFLFNLTRPRVSLSPLFLKSDDPAITFPHCLTGLCTEFGSKGKLSN